MNRRDFLRTAGIASATLALPRAARSLAAGRHGRRLAHV